MDMKIEKIDDNVLGMFVDNELDGVSREFVLNAMEENVEIREGVYELRRAKDLIKLGFGGAVAPTQTPIVPRSRCMCLTSKYGLAASVLILITSFGVGFLGYSNNGLFNDHSHNVASNVLPMANDRVLMHISESDPEKFGAVLAYARSFLEKHKKNGSQVAVIANAGGLDMMRKGVSPYEDEILSMMREYKNMHFIACINSIRTLRSKGIEPEIINNIDTSKPLMEQIISHVQEGWSYIRVKSVPELEV